MRAHNFTLIFILLFLIIFTVSIVKLTNWNIERMYWRSYENTFYLLSLIVDNYLQEKKELEDIEIGNAKKKSIEVAKNPQGLNESFFSETLQGIWIFKKDLIKGITHYSGIENEIIRFYEGNLKGKNAHTMIIVENKPFCLINSTVGSLDVLLLSDAKGISGTRLNQLLDFLVSSSDLVYFCILDENQVPILYSSLYENFLPLKGEGFHIVKTPVGSIFQIEEKKFNKNFVAGFTTSSLERIKSGNILFLILVIVIFIMLEAVLFYNFVKFERFKVKKEKEVNLFKEIGALSTGFAHEFRNPLHTISLLAHDLNGENRNILTEEIERMRSVMNSLKLLGVTEIDKKEVEISSLVGESISLLKKTITKNDVTFKKNIDENLTVYGNRTLFVTAFSNLIKNSIEAHAKNVTITGLKKGNKLTIDFIDNGRGIDANIIDKIFEPFFSKKGHSGLGLYLVKKIIEVHGGALEVQSNKNTIFKIILKIR